jgi:hypothetical protein
MLSVQELLSDPKRHCKGWEAKDSRGNDIDYDSPEAVSWCLVGAVWRCYGIEDNAEVFARLNKALEGLDCASYNDAPKTTHADVLKIVRLANV